MIAESLPLGCTHDTQHQNDVRNLTQQRSIKMCQYNNFPLLNSLKQINDSP